MTDLKTLLDTYDRLSAESADSGQPLSDLTDVPRMLDELVSALRVEKPKLEILHSRDPDGDCMVLLWVNGEQTGAWIEDIDPGAGHEREDVEQRIADTEAAEGMSDDFKQATLASLADAPFRKYSLRDWDED